MAFDPHLLRPKPDMSLFGGKKRTVGLDIGSGLVKLVVIDHSKGEPELVKVAITPVLADAIVEGEVMDPGIVADAIRGLFVSGGVKQKNVVAAVGGRDVIVKKIQMDRMKDADAREVIRWEAEQHVPFDMENVELDFQILDPGGEGLQMSVLLVAAKRELVENKVSLLTDAGLVPEIIDVDAFALHNAFEVNHPDAMQGMVGVLNIGHEVTNINILEDGVPVLTRDLAIGTRRFREDLQRERGLTAEDAEKLLQAFERSPVLDPYVESRGEEMAVGIERAAAFLQTSSRGGATMSKIYTSGGGSRIPGLSEVLAQRLGVAFERANPIQNIKVRDGVFDTLAVDEVVPLLMLPVGLALRAA
jgi:type IV pilus assembly protein PilM